MAQAVLEKPAELHVVSCSKCAGMGVRDLDSELWHKQNTKLNELMELGFVERIFSNPHTFMATPLESVTSTLLKQKAEKLIYCVIGKI